MYKLHMKRFTTAKQATQTSRNYTQKYKLENYTLFGWLNEIRGKLIEYTVS